MLYTIIYTHRTGSNAIAHKLSSEFGILNLGEVMYPYRVNLSTNSTGFINQTRVMLSMVKSDCIAFVEKLLSNDQNVLVKFHIMDLIQLYIYSPRLVKDIFEKSSKLFYTIRLDHEAQIKSQLAANKTQVYHNRQEYADTTQTILIRDTEITQYSNTLLQQTSIQGQWYTEFPGVLFVLENWSASISNTDYKAYPNCYTFKISSKGRILADTECHTLFPKVDILEILQAGNTQYSLADI